MTSDKEPAPRSRFSAGVMEYREMGYWQPDYVPGDTDQQYVTNQ